MKVSAEQSLARQAVDHYSCFNPDTAERFPCGPEQGRQVLTALATGLIAPEASDLALLEDPTHAAQLAAEHIANEYNLDPPRTRRLMDHVLQSCGPTVPNGLELLAVFADGPLSMIRRVAACRLFPDPLAFCET